MRLLSKSSMTSLEDAVARYEESLTEAASYLKGRGIPVGVAARYRLGVAADPVPGHGMFKGRLCIPYFTPAGVTAVKFRDMTGTAKLKYDQPKGQETRLYNVWARQKPSDVIAVCEGELDALVLDGVVGIPAVGVPGSSHWKPHWPSFFSGYREVRLYADSDEAGSRMADRWAQKLPQLTVVQLPDGMDVNDTCLKLGKGWFL